MHHHSDNVAMALAVTAEICGSNFSKPAAQAVLNQLRSYPESAVLKSLTRCQTELTGKLTLAAIIQRIDDGRPDADEAWSIALKAMDESATVVLNNEIAEAYGIAKDIFMSGDEVGARMAFRSAYDRIKGTARASGTVVQWFPSLGENKSGREPVLRDAVRLGRLSSNSVINLLHQEINPEVISLVNASIKIIE